MICKICKNNSFNKKEVLNPQNLTESYTYYFCTECGSGYIFDVPEKSLSNNYDSDYNEYEDYTKKSLINNILEFLYVPRRLYLHKYSKNFNSILDIGCGNGTFISSVADLFKEYYASEFNNFAFEKALKKVKNIKNVGDDLSHLTGIVDVVTMWHVLEHIPDPRKFLGKVIKHFDANSRLIIEVPNSDSINFKVFKKNYKWISLPEHIFFYNRKSLKYLLEGLGLEIVDISYPRMFPLLFSNHIDSYIFKILTFPISIAIFLISPYFGATESIRITCKLK